MIICLIALPTYGATTVTNQFESGTPALAEQVNQNFQDLATAIDTTIGDIGCTTDQIIVWNDAVSAWVCESGFRSVFGEQNTASPGTTNTDYCYLGEIKLTAATIAVGLPADGRLLQIADNTALFSLFGTIYGGDGRTTFGIPDLRDAAPDGLTYSVCTSGIYPSRD